MDALISTIIVMVPLLLIWFWERWWGIKLMMKQIEEELENSSH
jgi:hypothetical protein